MAFGGLKKLIRKNKGGIKKLTKLGAQYALSAALPVIGSKLATVGVGVVKRVASAPARRKAQKEKEGKINAALAAQIAKPQLQMMASRDTDRAQYGPGGVKTAGGGKKKSSATHFPGGATMAQAAKSASSHKGSPLGIAGSVGDFLKGEVKRRAASNKAKAAEVKKQQAAEKKAIAAASRKLKADAKRAAAAEKKAAKAAEKAAGKSTAAQGILASALGVKLGKSKTAKAAAGKIQRAVVAGTKRAVKGKAKNLIPLIGGTSAVLGAGGAALSANAKSQVRKIEKKLGRKLTNAEVNKVTTPTNTFLGK